MDGWNSGGLPGHSGSIDREDGMEGGDGFLVRIGLDIQMDVDDKAELTVENRPAYRSR